MASSDLQNAQFGQYGSVVADGAAGATSGPFNMVDPVDPIKLTAIDIEGMSSADATKLVNLTTISRPIYGKINSITVATGSAVCYKAKNDLSP